MENLIGIEPQAEECDCTTARSSCTWGFWCSLLSDPLAGVHIRKHYDCRLGTYCYEVDHGCRADCLAIAD